MGGQYDAVSDVVIIDEAEDGAGDESGCEVGGEIVVDEQLAGHEEEGEVVHGPEEEEEAGRVPEAVADGWEEEYELATFTLGRQTEGNLPSGIGSAARRRAKRSAPRIPTKIDSPTTQIHHPTRLPIR